MHLSLSPTLSLSLFLSLFPLSLSSLSPIISPLFLSLSIHPPALLSHFLYLHHIILVVVLAEAAVVEVLVAAAI